MTVYITPKILNPFMKITTRELAEHFNFKCQCGCGQSVYRNNGVPEANHCMIHDRKRYHTQITIPMNLELVSSYCHQLEKVHTTEHRLMFYEKQCNKYNKNRVDGWLKSLLESTDIHHSEIDLFLNYSKG